MQERSEEAAGGFENPAFAETEPKNKAEPLPPWFSGGSLEDDIRKQNVLENEDRERAREFSKQFQFQSRDAGALRRHETGEVIDLEAEDEGEGLEDHQVVDLEAEDTGKTDREGRTAIFDPKIRMGDSVDKMRFEPPIVGEGDHRRASPQKFSKPAPFEMDDSSDNDVPEQQPPQIVSGSPMESAVDDAVKADGAKKHPQETTSPPSKLERQAADEDDEMLDWSESDDGHQKSLDLHTSKLDEPAGVTVHPEPSRSPSVEFEDVTIPEKPASPKLPTDNDVPALDDDGGPGPAFGLVQDFLPDDVETAEFDDFSDPEDEELLHALTLEAEEHARFASTLNNKPQAQNIADYAKELKQLRNQQKKDRRDADEVTHIMIQECQQLLRLFGLPYVTAPMEAEAQCAELVTLGLVDGIVTDDSDCFLFGGTRVYKNMFNQAKFVECYLTSDLEKEFDLTREKMIQVAHLLGSDYTEGLPGVGPVTALEILGEFQTLDEFRTWWSGVQMNTIPKSADMGKPFRKKFRRNATKLFIPATFPDARVDIAYMHPDVDADAEPFQWGVPDLDALRSFLMATIGWSQERTDEVLVPVIKDMNRRADEGTQANITAFFDGGVGIGAAGATVNGARGDAFAPRKRVAESSKRMGTALSRMAENAKLTRHGSIAEAEPNGRGAGEVGQQRPATTKKRATGRKKPAKPAKPDSSAGSSEGDGSDFETSKKNTKKRPASGKIARGRKKTQVAS